MTNITEAQRELLARAAQDPEGAIDTPQDEKARRALIKKGLAISLPVAGGGSRLIITDAGRAAATDEGGDAPRDGSASTEGAIGSNAAEAEGDKPATGADETITAEAKQKAKASPSGKLGTLVELMKRSTGATLEEMVTATGWQTHSVRGAMSGSLKKKFGLTIDSAKTDGTRVYRITVVTTAEPA